MSKITIGECWYDCVVPTKEDLGLGSVVILNPNTDSARVAVVVDITETDWIKTDLGGVFYSEVLLVKRTDDELYFIEYNASVKIHRYHHAPRRNELVDVIYFEHRLIPAGFKWSNRVADIEQYINTCIDLQVVIAPMVIHEYNNLLKINNE